MKKKQLIGLIVAGLVFVFVCSSSILVNNMSKQYESSSKPGFFNRSSYILPPVPHIAVVEVKGSITDSYTIYSYLNENYNHQDTLKLIDELKDSSFNRGILLYVDSPGGTVAASDELYLKLKEYTEETGRPVWTYMGEMACSGGYYIAMASEKVYANRNTWTGSIGVILSYLNYKDLYEKIGVKGVYFTSGDNKAMGAGDLDLTQQQQEIFQSLVDEAYEQFVEIVAEGRNMAVDRVKELADGRIYSAKQALNNGLIDEIATYDEVKETFSMELGGAIIYKPESKETSRLRSLFAYVNKLKPRSDAEMLIEFIDSNRNGVLMYYAEPLF